MWAGPYRCLGLVCGVSLWWRSPPWSYGHLVPSHWLCLLPGGTQKTRTQKKTSCKLLNCKTSKVKLQCASFHCYLSRHGLVPLWRLLCSQSKQKQSPWIGATAGHIRSWRLPGGRISRRHPSGPSPWCTSSGQKLRGKGLDPDLPVNFTFSMWIQWHTNFKKTGQSTDKFITSLPQCACSSRKWHHYTD